MCTDIWVLGCHDGGYIPKLRSFIASQQHDMAELVLLPTHTKMAAGFAGLGLRLLKIPRLFLPDKINTGLEQDPIPISIPSPMSPHLSSDGALMGETGSGPLVGRINQNPVELIKSLSSPWKWN